jgi:hypothetical protein
MIVFFFLPSSVTLSVTCVSVETASGLNSGNSSIASWIGISSIVTVSTGLLPSSSTVTI